MKFKTRDEWSKRQEVLIWRKNCPFCKELREEEYIIWKWKYWYVKQNKYPYTKNNFHVMIIPIEHYEFSHEIPNVNWNEMKEVHTFLESYFKNKEYFSFTRETFWNRSIKHLHMHIIHGKISPWVIMKTLEEQWIWT